LFFICLLLSRSVAAQPPPSLSPSTDVVKGDSLYGAFNNEEALVLYKKAFSYDSSFAVRLRLSRTNFDYGLDLMAQNDEAAAKVHFEQSILHAQSLVGTYPDSSQSHFMLAATMGNLAQFESGKEKVVIGLLVEKHSRMAISLDSTWAYPYVSLGIYFRELSRLSWLEKTLAKVFYGRIPNVSEEEVLDLLLRAAEIKPDFPFLHYEIAMTYMMYDNPSEALKHFDILVGLRPETSQDVRNQENAQKLMASMGGSG
nr:hypothetical protein [Rhodothermaceae bacterium]